jgi:hypothetical protein
MEEMKTYKSHHTEWKTTLGFVGVGGKKILRVINKYGLLV